MTGRPVDLPEPPTTTPPPTPPRPSSARATPVAQLTTFAVCVLGMGLACTLAEAPLAFVLGTCVLGGSIALGLAVDSARWFRHLAGWAAACLAMIVMLFLWAFLESRAPGSIPVFVVVLAGLFVLGLDWAHVARLRAAIVLSGLFAATMVGSDASWAYPAALAWLVGAFGGLWVLARDERAALPAPTPLHPGAEGPALRAADLGRTVAVAVGVGLVVALLVGNPSCNLDPPAGEAPGGIGGVGRLGDLGDRLVGPSEHLGSLIGPDGERYDVWREAGRTVVRDGSGAVVPGWKIREDHLYVRDDAGRVLIPSPDGWLPAPPGFLPDDVEGAHDVEGRELTTDESGRTIIRDPDGTTMVMGEDHLGRTTMRVDRGDEVRTYVFDKFDGSLRVYEYDDQGSLVGDFIVDPEGTGIDPPDRLPGSDAAPLPRLDEASPPDTGSGPDINWWLVAMAIALVAAVGVVAYVLTTRARPGPAGPDPSWAEAMARRIEHEGREHGRARRPDETVVSYADLLADDTLPDERLATVGTVVSSALYGPRPPTPEERAWVETVVAEVADANPPGPPPRSARWRLRRER